MIVNSLKDGWEVIYQRSHALLAAMLAAAWRQDDHPPRWTELLIAIAQHDDQEMFWESSPHLTDLGAPLDFTQGEMNTTKRQARYVIDNAYRQGLWVALLISKHNSFLYEPLRGQDENLDIFLDQQQTMQQAWREQLGYSKNEVERAYAFVRWGDRLSLILCRDELPTDDRWLDVSPSPDGQMVRVQRRDGFVTLDPWVFEEEDVEFSVEVRRLDDLQFDGEESFRKALNAAEIERRTWMFCRSAS